MAFVKFFDVSVSIRFRKIDLGKNLKKDCLLLKKIQRSCCLNLVPVFLVKDFLQKNCLCCCLRSHYFDYFHAFKDFHRVLRSIPLDVTYFFRF